MNDDLRSAIERIYRAAIRSVDPQQVVERAIILDSEMLSVGGRQYAIPPVGTYAIAIGKASAAMLVGLSRALGDGLVAGIGVAKHASLDVPGNVDMHIGAHPVPDERSLSSGRAVVEFSASIPCGALVFCLISGGGSALVEALKPDVELADLRRVTSHLLRHGASIHELNAVRSRMSTLKGGGLLHLLRHTTVINLVVSDVLGDDLNVIASGPTVPSIAIQRAEDVVERFRVKVTLPQTELIGSETIGAPQCVIVANLDTAIDAAAEEAETLGYATSVVARSLEGEACEVAARFASKAVEVGAHSSSGRPICLLAGGETTVTVAGNGVGGRNTEAALAAAIRLSGAAGVAIGFLATDGDDGMTGAAGAIIDGATVPVDLVHDASQALRDNDSFSFLARRGSIWSPGATGTNVNDLMIALLR